MEKTILAQLEIIEKSNEWIKSSLNGEKQKNAYRKMVDCRRKLNKKKFALESNPAAAMYGESQVGKSYLISSLLSEDGKPFGTTNEEGVFYNFIEEMNPPGGGNESTSLVSRFSVNYKPINPKFPVKAILLSPADIVLVLCDSFYNDIKADHNFILQPDQINSEIEILKENFNNRQTIQKVFEEDDVLDMQDYFRENFSSKANNVIFSNFFEEISLLISKAKPNEWKDIFSLLWNKNEKITILFASLINEYEKLNFSSTVYLPLESVLYKHGTLLDVKRLKEIYAAPNKIESEYKSDTMILVPVNNQEIQFPKSYLCALAAELVFCQQDSLLTSKPFLKETDLLDFPGARGRMTLPQNDINNENIPELLLRGKVAYLFNKYSEYGKINIFVLCAKHDQAAQRSMPFMLNNWINKFIGDTPEKREIFVNNAKVPPLFIVGTFFNVNLEYNPTQDRLNNSSSLDYRWEQRFEKSLSNEVLDTKTYQWFNNWTITDKDFKNIFLLRDFVFSESKSQLFKGYLEQKKEIEEINHSNYPNLREKLRQSFIEYPFVIKHFENPSESWDKAASINEDGTKLIIDKLTIAANNINQARIEKMRFELNEISVNILSELLKYFHSNDKDDVLIKAKSTAGEIQHKLDVAFSADGIKLYGQLMKEFMIDESVVLELFRKKIDDIEHREVINMDIYSNYRIQVPVIENDSIDGYFERLCVHYEKITEEQKKQFKNELDLNKIELSELINGNSELIKNNALQLAEKLIEHWFLYINLNDKQTIQKILGNNGSSSLQDITDMFQKLFKKFDIPNKIAKKIHFYVEGNNKSNLPYEIIADISAELLNKCINSVGFDFFDESEINDLIIANDNNNLGLVLEHQSNPREESVAELFEKIEHWNDIIQSNPEEMKSLPSYRNYLLWYDRLKIAFVSVCDIPNYDIAANERLGVIIKESETVKY